MVYFIEIWARGGSRRGASKTFEQVGRGNPYVNQKRKEMRSRAAARSPASCELRPRFFHSCRPDWSPGRWRKTNAQWRAPGRRLFDRIRRSNTKHHSHPNTQEAKKRGRYLAPATARKPRAAIPERPQSRQSTRPDAWQAAHTQLSNNHSSKTCLARAHMHTLRQVRFLAQRIAAPVPVGAELARLQYFERHLYAFLFVRKLSPYGDEL